MRNKIENNNRSKKNKTALSFYDNSLEAPNQYYIDKANFKTFSIKGRWDFFTKLGYDDTLIELSNNGLFLKKVEDPLNINRKMCEIALYQDIRSLVFVPENMLGELLLTFEKRCKKRESDAKDKLVIDTLFEEIDARGLSIDELDYNVSNKRRQDHELSETFYDLTDVTGHRRYKKDRAEFNVVEDYFSIFYGMSYGEVLQVLYYDGMLLGEMEHENINLKMCNTALSENEDAINFVPKEFDYSLPIAAIRKEKSSRNNKNYANKVR